jgi:hypothetical protein
VSLFSLFASLAGFVWNVWSKFIYPKAKIRSNVAVMLIMDGDGTPPRKFVQLSATNYGPTEITLRSHQARRRQGFLWFRRNCQLAFVNSVAHPDSGEPAGWIAPDFPKKLAVGESATVYFSAQSPKRWIEEGDLYYFGFTDTFGRLHWCSRANAKKFRQDVIKNFGAIEPTRPGLLDATKAGAVRFWHKVATGARV